MSPIIERINGDMLLWLMALRCYCEYYKCSKSIWSWNEGSFDSEGYRLVSDPGGRYPPARTLQKTPIPARRRITLLRPALPRPEHQTCSLKEWGHRMPARRESQRREKQK